MSTLGGTPAVPITFKRNAREALADPQLRRNFRGAMDFLMDKRRSQFPDGDELERLRAFGNRVRARALSKLPELLERLEANLTCTGRRRWRRPTPSCIGLPNATRQGR